MDITSILLVMATAFFATASPGVSTLAIANVTMSSGRKIGIVFASGIVLGSIIWSFSAAFSLLSLLTIDQIFIEVIRYCGAAYLCYLAFKSGKAALSTATYNAPERRKIGYQKAFFSGLLIHLTNPKVILFFISLFAALISDKINYLDMIVIIFLLAIQSAIIFASYVFIFSSHTVLAVYHRKSHLFNGIICLLFLVIIAKLLFADLSLIV